MIDRRAFIYGASFVFLAAPLAAEAQPVAKVTRLGVLLFSTPAAEPTCLPYLQACAILAISRAGILCSIYRGAEGPRSESADLRTRSWR